MAKHASEPKSKYEVRQVEAWADEENGWSWNNSWQLGFFYTRSDNVGKALTRYLKTKHKIVFKLNRTLVESDGGDIYEIVDRKTKEPLFAAIWTEEDAK